MQETTLVSTCKTIHDFFCQWLPLSISSFISVSWVLRTWRFDLRLKDACVCVSDVDIEWRLDLTLIDTLVFLLFIASFIHSSINYFPLRWPCWGVTRWVSCQGGTTRGPPTPHGAPDWRPSGGGSRRSEHGWNAYFIFWNFIYIVVGLTIIYLYLFI